MKLGDRVLRVMGFAIIPLMCLQPSAGQKVQEASAATETLAASGSSTPRSSKPSDTPVVTSAGYHLGVEDELQISVWREPELSSSVVVRPDGVITLPLINDLHVVGLTTKELQDTLTEKFKGFVNEPQVTVTVKQIRSRKVYLVGEVPRPGAFPLNGTKTVLQLIAEAGGLSQFAKSGSIYVLRQQEGRAVRLPFSYKKALRSGSDHDVTLLPGDMVVVP